MGDQCIKYFPRFLLELSSRFNSMPTRAEVPLVETPAHRNYKLPEALPPLLRQQRQTETRGTGKKTWLLASLWRPSPGAHQQAGCVPFGAGCCEHAPRRTGAV